MNTAHTLARGYAQRCWELGDAFLEALSREDDTEAIEEAVAKQYALAEEALDDCQRLSDDTDGPLPDGFAEQMKATLQDHDNHQRFTRLLNTLSA